MNDYRNRFAHPVMAVFLQPDPIGFKGDPLNLYRFCTNNAVNNTDPDGLISVDWSWSRAMYMQGSALLGFSDILAAYLNYRKDLTAQFHKAIDTYKNNVRPIKDAGAISAQAVGQEAFDAGRETGEKTADDFHSDHKGRYNIEHASSTYANGRHVHRIGPVRGGKSRYSPHANLPTWTEGKRRLIGSHGHGIQSEPRFNREDLYGANGGYTGSPYIAALGLAADRGHRVIIYVPLGGGRGLTVNSTDGRRFFEGD